MAGRRRRPPRVRNLTRTPTRGPVGQRFGHGAHADRGIDTRNADPRPAREGAEGQLPGACADVEHPQRPMPQPGRDPVQEPVDAGCQHRRPPARVTLGDPIVALGLLGHPRIVPWRRASNGPRAPRHRQAVEACASGTCPVERLVQASVWATSAGGAGGEADGGCQSVWLFRRPNPARRASLRRRHQSARGRAGSAATR